MPLSNQALDSLSHAAIAAACQAGQLIADYAQRQIAVHTKPGGSSLAAQVVTEVDHLSQAIIFNHLLPTCDDFDLAMLSEETPDDRARLHKPAFWCIDPLDGTLPFIESVPGYSVSIALVSQAGEPLVGVVYDPLSQALYHAIKGQGAWKNRQAIEPAAPADRSRQHMICLTDKSFAQDARYAKTQSQLEQIAEKLGYAGAKLQLQGGAAMNACQVLDGSAACYFKLPKPQAGGGSIWDYAATACLFKEAGLPFSDASGQALVLNPEGSTFLNHCGVLYCGDWEVRRCVIEVGST